MKMRVRKTALLTVVCFAFTAVQATAFWSSRVLATAEESVLTVATGSAPTIQPIEAETVAGVMIEIPLTANDADGDAVAFRIDQMPGKGTAVIENDKLIYTPAEGKTGTDKFTYCALDTMGNCSEPAQVKIKIKKNSAKFTYADMADNPAHLAALTLHEEGILTGEKIGTSYFFHPADTLTRGEFIAMAVAAGDYELPETSRTDFADDDALSPWIKPYISTAASNGLISGYQTVSGAAEIRSGNTITLNEASSIICNLISPYLDAPVAASVQTENADWAASANAVLTAANIMPEQTMGIDGSSAITRQTACEMIYSAMQYMK